MDTLQLYPTFSLIITVVVGAVLLFRQYKQGKAADDDETINKFEQAVKVRDIENQDLRNEIQKQKEATQEMVKGLQAQITSLQTQVAALLAEKKVLENTVSGEAYLLKIIDAVGHFEQFALQASAEHKRMEDCIKEIIDQISDIKSALELKQRRGDTHTKASN